MSSRTHSFGATSPLTEAEYIELIRSKAEGVAVLAFPAEDEVCSRLLAAAPARPRKGDEHGRDKAQ